MDNQKALEQFRLDVAKFSGNYKDFLIIAKTDNQFLWKATDDTWGIGAAIRYLAVLDERDRLEETFLHDQSDDNEN